MIELSTMNNEFTCDGIDPGDIRRYHSLVGQTGTNECMKMVGLPSHKCAQTVPQVHECAHLIGVISKQH